MWFLFALASAFFAALNRILIKSASEHAADHTIVLWRNLFAGMVGVAILPFIPIPPVETPFFYSLPAACFFDVVAITFMSKSLRYASMGSTVPLLSFTPVFLLVTGFLVLREFPTMLGLVGVLVIVTGSYCQRRGGEGSKSLIHPFIMVARDRGAKFMLGTAACFAFAGPFFKKTVQSSSPHFSLAYTLPTAATFMFIYHMASGGSKKELRLSSSNWWILGLLGLSVFMVAWTTNLAFNTGLISYVVSIKRLSILMNVFIGVIVFRESGGLRNMVSAILMVIGAAMIALSP